MAGRGVRPRWLQAALKEGHKIEEFAICEADQAGRCQEAQESGVTEDLAAPAPIFRYRSFLGVAGGRTMRETA